MGPYGQDEAVDFVLRVWEARQGTQLIVKELPSCGGSGPESRGMTEAQTGFMGMMGGNKPQKCHQENFG